MTFTLPKTNSDLHTIINNIFQTTKPIRNCFKSNEALVLLETPETRLSKGNNCSIFLLIQADEILFCPVLLSLPTVRSKFFSYDKLLQMCVYIYLSLISLDSEKSEAKKYMSNYQALGRCKYLWSVFFLISTHIQVMLTHLHTYIFLCTAEKDNFKLLV